MSRVVAGFIVGIAIGSALPAGAAWDVWAHFNTRYEKAAFVSGIADGITFINNSQATSRGIELITRDIVQCGDVSDVVNRVDQFAQTRTMDEGTAVEAVVAAYLACAGAR
jgi:hypothetical protein